MRKSLSREDGTVTTQNEQNEELLNIFFSNAVKNFKYLY